jgi:hypothetical protein
MSSWGVISLWTYLSLEANLFLIYRRSIRKCKERLQASSPVPPHVSNDLVKQLKVMPRIRTFFRDLFGAAHHTDIKYKNIENLFIHTIGITSQAVISYMIRLAEQQLDHAFAEGNNDALQHTYCKEDQVIRARYVPAFLTSPLIFAKCVCDWYTNLYFERVNTPHVVYWIQDKGQGRSSNRVLLFICGIGIGPITYFNLIQQFVDVYDVIIMVEIKWISFHINTDPVADMVLIQDIASFVAGYLHKRHLGCYYHYPFDNSSSSRCSDDVEPLLQSCCDSFYHNNHHSHTARSSPPSCPCDVMMHSGGALYFRRLIEKLNFRYKILIEPACFLGGSSTATLQLYTYHTINPLFQFPLIKNLPKLLDITECVLQTDTPMNNTFLILSQQDTLFDPIPCAQFMSKFHPNVEIYFVENSSHGGAVATHYLQTANIILKKLGC